MIPISISLKSLASLAFYSYWDYSFLSPAHRGRGVLVAPEFCPASGFFVVAKTQKLLVNFFRNFNTTFLATWGFANDFLKMLPKFKMTARGQLQKILWEQKLLEARNYSNFTITFPTIWRCAGDIFKVLLKFKMAAMDQLQFFRLRKNSKK